MKTLTHRPIGSRSLRRKNNKLFLHCNVFVTNRYILLLFLCWAYVLVGTAAAKSQRKSELSIAETVGEGKSNPAQRPTDRLMKALVPKATGGTDKDGTGDVVTLSWQTIFTDGFEGAWYWTTYGYPTWRDTSYRSNTGSWSAWCADDGLSPPGPYASNMDAYMVYGPFDLSNADDARVTFSYWLDSESDYDYFWWFSSGDGTNFSGDRISGYFPYWQSQTFSLSDRLGDSSVWFAFNFDSDFSNQYEGAYVDDVVIEKYVSTLPDLVIERLYVSPSSSVSGTPVTATVKVTNRGGVAAGAFDVDFYKDRASAPGSGDVGDPCNVFSLDAGDSTTLEWDFTPPGDGSYNAWAQVDRTNAVSESDETNNRKGPFFYKVEESGDVTYHAVICGIADYPGTENDLDWTDDDAIDLNDTLVQYPEWSSANIQLLIDSAATKAGIKAAVETMRQQADGNDICLFFFSGHGTTGSDVFPFDESDDVDEYLVSCDTGGLSDWIRDDEFGEWFEAFPAPVIVLLDTCHSGGQIKGLATADYAIKSFSMGYPSPAKGDGFAADIQRRLEAKPSGRKDIDDTLTAGGVVVTAADDNEPSWEIGALENSLFTDYVLEALDGERETADADDDGDVSAEEVNDYAGPLATQYCIDHGMEPEQYQHAQLYDNYPADSPASDDLAVITYRYTLTTSSTAGGSVTAPGEGDFDYDPGTVVSIIAKPDDNCEFVNWTGSGVTAGKVANPDANDTTITMDADFTLQANFALSGEPPVLHTEPNITPGLCNTIYWDLVVDANEYYAECANDANFSNIDANSGWITEPNCEFCGLTSGQMYWYRVKARTAGDFESNWSNVESSLQCALGDFEPDCDVDMADLAVFVDQWLLAELSADVAPIDEGDNFVDFFDWAVFANAWQSTPASPNNWNPKCDIAPEEGDDIVDIDDLAVFMYQWLQLFPYRADIAPVPDGDGRVDMLDFAVFAENWLEGEI